VQVIGVETSFPGVDIDSPNPGDLPSFGLDPGTYNTEMLCIEGIVGTGVESNSEIEKIVDDLYDSDDFGVLSQQRLADITGVPQETLKDTRVLSLLCVETIGPDQEDGPLNDNVSLFRDGKVTKIRQLYKYEISNLFGESISVDSSSVKTDVNVLYFESHRHNERNEYDPIVDIFDDVGIDPVDDEVGIDPVIIDKRWIDDYKGQGWAYLEDDIVKRQQEPLVDTNKIYDAIIYNGETGDRSATLEAWDPFKGILPGFIRNEIDYISEEDPVTYGKSTEDPGYAPRTSFGQQNVGKVWWDTSTIRYQWYEQGTMEERRRNWGRTFPGSAVTVCEWVESKAIPQNWTGNGVPRWRDRYITERRKDPLTGEYEFYHYFWVQNRSIVDNRVAEQLRRKLDTQTIARYIANPVGYGLNLVGYVSDNSMALFNAPQVMDFEENHLQVNFNKSINENGIDHTAWKLLREGDVASRIPDNISDKLIDSLCGENMLGQEVPDPRLSIVEKYGGGFRPRQSMFVDLTESRRVMVSTLNRMLADTKLRTLYPEWDSSLPDIRTYIKDTNWYEVLYIDVETNTPVRYDNSYKPLFSVASSSELERLTDQPDGTVIQVSSVQNNSEERWIYVASEKRYKRIAIINDTVKLTDNVFTDENNSTLSNELRLLLNILKDEVFANDGRWNQFVFEMIKHAYMEQGQLDWAFKTSYLYVSKEENDLIQYTGFKADYSLTNSAEDSKKVGTLHGAWDRVGNASINDSHTTATGDANNTAFSLTNTSSTGSILDIGGGSETFNVNMIITAFKKA